MMKSSTRIILNTLATYGHSLFALVAGLFSARWVLRALGESDFGLYGVVGSIIMLITLLNGGMAAGVSRFYAFSIGRGHNLPEAEAIDDLKRWFNTAFSIHSILPILVVLAGWPIGEYVIQNWLTIPPDRVVASVWVFRISLVTALMNVISVPFTAMYSAHQLIAELAMFNILGAAGTFAGAWLLLGVESDRLIVYALYMSALNVGIACLLIARAAWKFKACRIRFAYLFNLDYLRNLFQFVGWKMLGISCVVLRGQGAPVLINLKFGPLVNAGYSIAYRLSIQATSLSEALTGAFQPALTSSEGKGDRNDMLAMAMQVCKFGALLVVLFVLPLTLEMDTVMKLWLGSPPDYAGPLCQWMLAMLLLDKLTAGPMLAVNAVGNIAAYELVQGSLYLLALPLMLLLFAAGIGPVAVGAALFASNAAYCAGRLLFSRRLAGFPVGRWFRTVALPFAFLTLLGVTAGWSVMQVFPPGFSRICLTTGITSLITMATGWFWLLDHKERRFVKNLLCKISTRLSPLGAASADIPAPRANHPNFPPE